MTKLVCFVDQ